MIGGLLTLVIYLVVLGLVFWLLDYLIRTIPLAEPFARIARIILIVLSVVIVIALLLSLVDGGASIRMPRF
jgi:preprotein translocase subunit SecE